MTTLTVFPRQPLVGSKVVTDDPGFDHPVEWVRESNYSTTIYRWWCEEKACHATWESLRVRPGFMITCRAPRGPETARPVPMPREPRKGSRAVTVHTASGEVTEWKRVEDRGLWSCWEVVGDPNYAWQTWWRLIDYPGFKVTHKADRYGYLHAVV